MNPKLFAMTWRMEARSSWVYSLERNLKMISRAAMPKAYHKALCDASPTTCFLKFSRAYFKALNYY